MSSLFVLKTTPSFEREFKGLTKRDSLLLEQFIKVIEILRFDPYNSIRQHDIKKLTNVLKGGGQWRIRSGNYRLRYDIFDKEVILHSISHRKAAYQSHLKRKEDRHIILANTEQYTKQGINFPSLFIT
jgi:mRNA-degrading endonuclease RelE of RelBE toxin-antitoxin system